MEANLWKALHDPATLSELAILALYGEAISYPYVKAIHTTSDSGGKENMLDLGPLHKKVSTHIHTIVANPDILLCENPSYITASLEGDEWQTLNIFKCIHDLNLPYEGASGCIFYWCRRNMDMLYIRICTKWSY